MINYAHRGASAYAPENTLASFYMGWQMGANGIETDVQRTKDGVPVLFHDNTLERIAGDPRSIRDLTLAELDRIDAGRHKGEKYAGERVPTLAEFLRHFSAKGLHLAMEIKQEGIERQVLEQILPVWPHDRLIMTSFHWESVLAVRRLAPDIRTGYLTRRTDDALIDEMKDAGIFQYCPDAASADAETIRRFREAGFSVRAWGVKTEELMRKMADLQVDGMTVNFPDLLIRYLDRKNG